MPFLQELMSGLKKPTAQEMAGGIPQNADPGKQPLLGNGLMGIRGAGSGGGNFEPPPVQQAAVPPASVNPAQLQQSAPVAPVAAPPAAPAGMGAAPMGAGATPMGGNPQMLQALMARQQAMGAR